jgi:hypothetical protein
VSAVAPEGRPRRVVVALDKPAQLSAVDHGVELARRHSIPIEILAGRARPWPMIHFAPIDVAALRVEIATEAHGLLIEAIARVPADVAVSGRLVDGKASKEVERLARSCPGELLLRS